MGKNMVSSDVMKRDRKNQIKRKGRRVTCLRCGWVWVPFGRGLPTRCANPDCRSPYWNQPRTRDQPSEEGPC
jgi:hypothetical protein